MRVLRIRHGWRQQDLSSAARVSRAGVSRLERGRVRELRVEIVVRIIEALGGRLEFVPRWRGGDLDRLLNARHAAMHELVARWFLASPGWELAPEVSFAIRGERGVLDILAWHAGFQMLLVIELKTEIVDINDLMGGVDRKRRLAVEIARERGWLARSVSVWVIVAEGSTNRRRVSRHRTTLRAAFPADGRANGWLARRATSTDRLPVVLVRCPKYEGLNQGLATVKRVRRPRSARSTLA